MATRGSPAVAFARRASARRASGGASPPRVPSSRLARVPARADASGGSTTAPSSEISRERLVEESLEACGWSELREHLAEYASTRLGQEACRDLPLPLGGPWESERLLDETEAAMAMESCYGTSLDIGGLMSAEVRRALYKAEKYASLGGDEFAAMAAFIASSTRLVKTIEGVRENGAPPAALAPLRSVVAAGAPRPEVADKIRACVDDQGGSGQRSPDFAARRSAPRRRRSSARAAERELVGDDAPGAEGARGDPDRAPGVARRRRRGGRRARPRRAPERGRAERAARADDRGGGDGNRRDPEEADVRRRGGGDGPLRRARDGGAPRRRRRQGEARRRPQRVPTEVRRPTGTEP